jgi:hypothetical protein
MKRRGHQRKKYIHRAMRRRVKELIHLFQLKSIYTSLKPHNRKEERQSKHARIN